MWVGHGVEVREMWPILFQRWPCRGPVVSSFILQLWGHQGPLMGLKCGCLREEGGRRGELTVCCSQLLEVDPSSEKTRWTVDFTLLSISGGYSPWFFLSLQTVAIFIPQQFKSPLSTQLAYYKSAYPWCCAPSAGDNHLLSLFLFKCSVEKAQNVIKDCLVSQENKDEG